MLTSCLSVKRELSLKQKFVFTKYKQLYSIVFTDSIGLAQTMKQGLDLNGILFLNLQTHKAFIISNRSSTFYSLRGNDLECSSLDYKRKQNIIRHKKAHQIFCKITTYLTDLTDFYHFFSFIKVYNLREIKLYYYYY